MPNDVFCSSLSIPSRSVMAWNRGREASGCRSHEHPSVIWAVGGPVEVAASVPPT